MTQLPQAASGSQPGQDDGPKTVGRGLEGDGVAAQGSQLGQDDKAGRGVPEGAGDAGGPTP